MPKKTPFLPTNRSCDRIRRLFEGQMPQGFGESNDPILCELANIEDGNFHCRIEQYRCIGRRIPERAQMESVLHDNGIEAEDISRDLVVHRTTIDRFFKGEGSTDLTERIFNRYPSELSRFQHPNVNEVYWAAYRHAIVEVRSAVLKAVGTFTRPIPPLNSENFSYLWHLLKSDTWRHASESGEETALEAATAKVAQQVRRQAPSYEQASTKTAGDLLRLQNVWEIWLRLVVYCEPNPADDAQDGV